MVGDDLRVCGSMFDDVVDLFNELISSMVVGEHKQRLSTPKIKGMKPGTVLPLLTKKQV